MTETEREEQRQGDIGKDRHKRKGGDRGEEREKKELF